VILLLKVSSLAERRLEVLWPTEIGISRLVCEEGILSLTADANFR